MTARKERQSRTAEYAVHRETVGPWTVIVEQSPDRHRAAAKFHDARHPDRQFVGVAAIPWFAGKWDLSNLTMLTEFPYYVRIRARTLVGRLTPPTAPRTFSGQALSPHHVKELEPGSKVMLSDGSRATFMAAKPGNKAMVAPEGGGTVRDVAFHKVARVLG